MPSDPHRRVMRTTGLGASAICLAGMLAWTTTVTALQAGLLPHKQLVPTAGELGQLARVRSLLATSTKENPNPVHIVFYGQSITLEPWWTKVASELRRMYPDALLTIENKAIAGFQDWALFRTVDADLVPIQPDLVILHAYGNGTGTDLMLGELRAKTVTDVLLQTDHVHGFDRMDEETDPAKIVYEDLLPYRNYVALPAAARRNDACLARIRDLWKAYLRTNDLPAEAMLSDASVHLNDDGNDLLAEFVLSYLEPGGWAEPIDPWNVPRVRTAVVGKDVRWRDGELECSFVGSVVAVVLQGVLPSDIDVLVDGQRPADRPELLRFQPHERVALQRMARAEPCRVRGTVGGRALVHGPVGRERGRPPVQFQGLGLRDRARRRRDQHRPVRVEVGSGRHRTRRPLDRTRRGVRTPAGPSRVHDLLGCRTTVRGTAR